MRCYVREWWEDHRTSYRVMLCGSSRQPADLFPSALCSRFGPSLRDYSSGLRVACVPSSPLQGAGGSARVEVSAVR